MYSCILIGLSDSLHAWFPPEVSGIISGGKVFSGGLRHHERVKEILPPEAVWIDITVPLENVLEAYEQYDEVVIFASGDPLFFGLASTLRHRYPRLRMTIYPTLNSLQTLAHRLCLPYQDMRAVSLTGRPWDAFDEALISGEHMIGCLTDRHKTPHTIWQRMAEYGYDNYKMYVGENLGNTEKERVDKYFPERTYAHPNCLILVRKRLIGRRMGIPDAEFRLLDGRSKMITKMPIRLTTIAALGLSAKSSLWDIGFCTGSVSIEAKLAHPHLHVTAFEIREEGRELMAANTRRFHVPGIHTIIGDFLQTDISGLEKPDAVFIGGHGGRLTEMVRKVRSVLQPGGCIVFNSVSDKSGKDFIAATTAVGMTAHAFHTITVDDNNPITIYKAT